MTTVAERTARTVRTEIAEGLAEAPVDVHESALDAVAGACLIVASGPRDPGNVCAFVAHPSVLCVAGRIEPGPAADMLDELVDFVLTAVRTMPLAVDRVEDQIIMSFGNVEYLTQRIVLSIPLVMMKGSGNAL